MESTDFSYDPTQQKWFATLMSSQIKKYIKDEYENLYSVNSPTLWEVKTQIANCIFDKYEIDTKITLACIEHTCSQAV